MRELAQGLENCLSPARPCGSSVGPTVSHWKTCHWMQWLAGIQVEEQARSEVDSFHS